MNLYRTIGVPSALQRTNTGRVPAPRSLQSKIQQGVGRETTVKGENMLSKVTLKVYTKLPSTESDSQAS